MKELVMVGSGGCMRELVWQIQEQKKEKEIWKIVGYVDRKKPLDERGISVGEQWIPYLGNDDVLLERSEKTNVASLLLYRILEKKLSGNYTCEEILTTLRSMQMTLLSKESGYIPSYKRTALTDDLHKTFNFHTDYEFISKSAMRNIIKYTKTKEIKK